MGAVQPMRGWELLQRLFYEAPTPQFEYGRDLCRKCAATGMAAAPSFSQTIFFKG